MQQDSYLGMRPGDLDNKAYAKYWNPDMAAMQSQVQQALLHGAEAKELGFGREQAHLLNQPGYLPLENGTTELSTGEVFVAVQTIMPGVTGAMFEWWMGWHTMEAQRYKLWHPRAHMANGTEAMQGDNPELSDREKYLTSHYVTEYIGSSCEDIIISFVPPETFFDQQEGLYQHGVTALVCGSVALQRAPINIAHIVHQIRDIEGGSEMRSRFWLAKPEFKGPYGRGLINKIINSKFLKKRLMPDDIGRDMLVHCGMEMNHLASFLPALYADYHH